jgi:hypothetical protein
MICTTMKKKECSIPSPADPRADHAGHYRAQPVERRQQRTSGQNCALGEGVSIGALALRADSGPHWGKVTIVLFLLGRIV